MGLELDSVVMVSFIIPTKLSREVTAKIRSLIRKEVDKWCDDYNLEFPEVRYTINNLVFHLHFTNIDDFVQFKLTWNNNVFPYEVFRKHGKAMIHEKDLLSLSPTLQ